MLVVDRLIHASLYSDRAAVRPFISRAAFAKLKVSFASFVMPILMITHRNTKVVVKSKLHDAT